MSERIEGLGGVEDEFPETIEEFLTRVAALVRESRMVCVGAVMTDDRLMIASMGITPKKIPALFRAMAENIETGEEMEEIQREYAALPPDRKGRCPGCNQQVVVTRPIPSEALKADSGRRALAVCTCGAFLVPARSSDGATLVFRFMTEQEVGDLPDDVRNKMVRVRRDFEEMRQKVR